MTIFHEKLIPLSEARLLLPGQVAPQTLERWIREGIRGVKLEVVYCGKRRYTSEEAIQRFLEGQNRNLEYPEPAIPRLNEAEILREKKALGI